MIRNVVLIFVTVLVITLPFIEQPYHIDDTLFIYTARSLNKNFFLPYNFSFPAEDRMRFGFEGFTNPPLNSYCIAVISRLFGEKPVILHSFFIAFALCAAFSLYILSKLFVKNTLIVTLFAITTPVFMLQSHSLMPDITVLGFWCSAVYCYIQGLDKNNKKLLLLSSFFISLALLTRYNGLLLIPLLFIYSSLRKNKFSSYFLYLLIPLCVFILWCLHNVFVYGRLHILASVIVSKTFYMHFRYIVPRVILHFVYIGSLMIFPVCFAPLLLFNKKYYGKNYFSIAIVLFLFNVLYFSMYGHLVSHVIFYSAITSFCFLFFLWLIESLLKFKNDNSSFYKSIDDLFLCIWIFIIIVFQSSIYFVAPKFILLLIPPITFLLFRVLERKYVNFIAYSKAIIFAIFTLGFLICKSEYLQAVFDSKEFSRVLNDYSGRFGKTVWCIDGDRNWGHYIPDAFSAVYRRHDFKEGDLILGTPYFFKDGINKKKLGAVPLKTIYYDTPFIKVSDQQNNIFLYFDGYGKYLPYSLSFKRTPMFMIWKVIPGTAAQVNKKLRFDGWNYLGLT